MCECEARDCEVTIRTAVDRHEAVRQFPTRFVMRQGHLDSQEERIVEEARRLVAAEKTGPLAQIAIRLDPRRRRHNSEAA